MVAAGVLLLVVGLLWWTGQSPAPRASAEGVASPTHSPSMDTTQAPVRARPVPGAPVEVRVPALGIVAPVIPVKAPGRRLVPPSDPGQLGWWADGAKPGARTGSALITGHSVNNGHGALNDLETIRRGDRIVVATRRDAVRYVVRQVRVFHKGTVARQAEKLFDQSVPGRLVLVTCEDWDGQQFLSNVVVTAVPVRSA